MQAMTKYSTNIRANLAVLDRVFLRSSTLRGVPSGSRRLYYAEQAPDGLFPQSATDPTSGAQIVLGAPGPCSGSEGAVVPCTNLLSWRQHGRAWGGAMAPCADRLAGVEGFACAAGDDPSAGGSAPSRPRGLSFLP